MNATEDSLETPLYIASRGGHAQVNEDGQMCLGTEQRQRIGYVNTHPAWS